MLVCPSVPVRPTRQQKGGSWWSAHRHARGTGRQGARAILVNLSRVALPCACSTRRVAAGKSSRTMGGDRGGGGHGSRGVAWRDERRQNERPRRLPVDDWMGVVALPTCQNKNGRRETHTQKETIGELSTARNNTYRAQDRDMHHCHSPAPVCRRSFTTNQCSVHRRPRRRVPTWDVRPVRRRASGSEIELTHFGIFREYRAWRNGRGRAAAQLKAIAKSGLASKAAKRENLT